MRGKPVNKRFDVLLVNPAPYSGTGKEKSIPYGLLCLAGVLLKKGFKVRVVDERVEKLDERLFGDSLMVGVSALTGNQITHALDVLKRAKSVNPGIVSVFGGIHVSMTPLQSIKNELVDVVVVGEGEITVVELAEAVKKGRPLDGIKGLVFKKGKKAVANPPREFMDLNLLPMVPIELLDLKKYNLSDGVSYQSSRGCPHRCTFCHNQSYNRMSYRTKKPGKVIKEIKALLKATGAKTILFSDDNFFTSKKRVEGFCDLVLKEKLKFKWDASCRADYFRQYDDSFIKKIKKSGCDRMSFGVESGSQRVLDYLRKDIVLKDVTDMVEKCKRNGIEPVLDFVLGLPTETKEELNETIRFADSLKKDALPVFFTFRPYPGAPLYDEVIRDFEWKAPKTLAEWGSRRMGDLSDCTWLSKRQKNQVETIFSIGRIYFAPHYYKFSSLKETAKSLAKIFLYLDSSVRWKLKFFDLALEWDLIKGKYG